jgi:hypothetical protein
MESMQFVTISRGVPRSTTHPRGGGAPSDRSV